MRTLRGRLLLSSVLWTVGLLFASSVPFTLLMEDQSRLDVAMHVHRFVQNPVVILTAVFCMVAGLVIARGGLESVDKLRSRLGGLRAGRDRRMDGTYPAEVQPLVDDLNALLEHREQAIQRAVAGSGDLAHGLKTPLAILAQEAERARSDGQHEIAGAIDQQVERMRRQVDYHLAQARAAASGATGGARASVKESGEGLARALLRLHAGRGISIDVQVAEATPVRVQREDLDEMLGNLLDNACKWARTKVTVNAAVAGAAAVITVDDDGRGIAAEMREVVLQRGVRADESAPGSGLGLAIVRDLAELYGGSISLDASPLGGTRAVLILPRVRRAQDGSLAIEEDMMNCYVHDRSAAVGLCAACQRAVCRECVGRDAPRIICRRCLDTRAVIGFEYRSAASIGNWPLVHVCAGVDPLTMRPRIAKGVIAVGNVAVGAVAVGGLACGLVALGGGSIGLLLALGGAAVGTGLSIGGVAVGSVALGGAAVGFVYAVGGAALGPAIIDGRRCDPAALEFVRQWLGTSMLPPSCR